MGPTELASAATGPLQGMRVLDMTSVVFGAYAAQLLGALGADVIKVEFPGGRRGSGDDIMRWAGQPPQGAAQGAAHDLEPIFMMVNFNKRSVLLDLREPQDAAALRALVPHCDVVATIVRHDGLQRIGEGQFVEVPMLECMTRFNLAEHFFGQVFEPPTGQWAYPRVATPNRRLCPTLDGRIGILPYSAVQWEQFFALAGWSETIARDPRLADQTARAANIDALYARLGEVTVTRTTAEWLALLRPLQISVVPMDRLDELQADPHLAAVGLFQRYEHPNAGTYNTPRPPVRYSATPANIRRHPAASGRAHRGGARRARPARRIHTGRRSLTDGVPAGRRARDDQGPGPPLRAAEMAWQVADHAMQTFGAMGVTRELSLQMMAARLRTRRIYDRLTEVHRWVVARQLLGTRR